MDNTEHNFLESIEARLRRGKCIPFDEFTDKDWDALKEANDRSNGRTRYGIRAETSGRPMTLMTWSNGAAHWFVSDSIAPGNKGTYDANQMLVTASPERMQRIDCYITPLPLFAGSFEARARGLVSEREALETYTRGTGVLDIARLIREAACRRMHEGDDSPDTRRICESTDEDVLEEINQHGWGAFFND